MKTVANGRKRAVNGCMCQGCFNNVVNMFQGCVKDVSRIFQGCLNDVFKNVTRIF